MSTNVTKENLQEFATKLHAKNKTLFATKAQVGSPLVASTVAGMTDTDKIYVYTGTEIGYTAGNWYYYDGSAWASGGVYNAEAVETDTTLSTSGMAADAKAVGDEFTKNLWGVPHAVREAIFTLLDSAAYADTNLTDEIGIVESWASEAASLEVYPTTLTLVEDTPQYITATVVPPGATISWTSSDPTIARVVNGTVIGISNGICVITATSGTLSASCTATVTGYPEVVSITATYTQTNPVFDTDIVEWIVDDLVVTATYDDTSTATISRSDYVLEGSLEVGTSEMTVYYNGKVDTFNVTVSQGLPSGYTHIEYTERPAGTGNTSGYNTSGLKLNGTDTALIRIGVMATAAPASSGGYFLVCRATNSNNTIGYGIYAQSGMVNYGSFDGTAVTISTFDGESILNKKVDLECTKTTTGMTISDGTHTQSASTTPRTMYNALHLFAMPPYTGSTLQNCAFGRIYYLTIYEGGTRKVNYIPCKHSSDIGFYDPIQETFKSSSAYVAGPVV